MGEHGRRTNSSIQTRGNPSSAFDTASTHNPTRIPASTPSMSSTEQYSLPWYRPAIRNFVMGCRPRRTVPLVGATNLEIGFEIKVRSGTADLKIRSGQLRFMEMTVTAGSYKLISRLLPSNHTCTIIYHEPECELICTICKPSVLARRWTTLNVSASLNKAPPPDDPGHPSRQPSSSRFARPWFPTQPPTREVTSYQSGGIPTWETAIGGGSGADEEVESQIQNQWETRYGMRVDLLAAWAYVLGPVTGARCSSVFRD